MVMAEVLKAGQGHIVRMLLAIFSRIWMEKETPGKRSTVIRIWRTF